MSYQALYRVWRPQTFDELVGQTMIANTLKNAVKDNQPSHAYLFTGSRGTGKTSTAKILAKAVNCPDQTDGNPCNECELCRGITEDMVSDVIEIDAASNNGVDEIRDLRENVRYAPTQAQYKVYIIDEVHMLTTGAFNALLKTLEEPPAQVIFILATTEPHRIPTTIISRTQRFDFQRIKDPDLMAQMEKILGEEGIDYEEEALAIISRAANGGMRDSLSLLDQSISYALGQKVTTKVTLEVSGSLDQRYYVDYLLKVYQGESEEALQILEQQFHVGKQASRFLEELFLFSRDMLLTLHTSQNHTLLTDDQIAPIREQIDAEFYYLLIDQLNNTQYQMRVSTHPDLYLEMLTVQVANRVLLQETKGTVKPVASSAVHTSTDSNVIQGLENRIQQLEGQLSDLIQQTQSIVNLPSQEKKTQTQVQRSRPRHLDTFYQQDLNDIYQVLNVATRDHLQNIKSQWERILNALPVQERNLFRGTQPLAAGTGRVLLGFERRTFCGAVQGNRELNDLLTHVSAEYLEEQVTFSYVLEQEWPEVRKNYRILWEQNNRQPIILQQEQPHEDKASEDAEEALDPATESVLEPSSPTPASVEEAVLDQPLEESIPQEIDENSEIPEVVQKAIDIFGEDNIEIKNQ